MPSDDKENDGVQADEDDLLIQDLLSGSGGIADKLGNIFDRELETGDKADDAIDFEDISDNDLASDADEPGTTVPAKPNPNPEPELDDIFSGDPDEDPFVDLFGETPSSPTQEPIGSPSKIKSSAVTDLLPFLPFESPPEEPDNAPSSIPDDKLPEANPMDSLLHVDDDDPETREQYELFRRAREECDERMTRAAEFAAAQGSGAYLSPPRDRNELFESVWPHFDRNERPYFGKLFAQKKAFYNGNGPPKPPRPIHPSKVSFELAPDQEKAFLLPGPARDPHHVRLASCLNGGLVLLEEEQEDDEELFVDDASHAGYDDEFGGVTIQELATLCEDLELDELEFAETTNGTAVDSTSEPPLKLQKLDDGRPHTVPVFFPDSEALEHPEHMTAQLARRVVLNELDPYLLLDHHVEDSRQESRPGATNKPQARNMTMKDWILERYNISNDAAYDMLKNNHSNRVRSNLGNLLVEHSLPAIKLQYPFYKVKLTPRESRTIHRPKFKAQPNSLVHLNQSRVMKRKNLKGKTPTQIFSISKDLNVGDNSNVILLEYSEECPTMMSNFGMSSRLINYYRRQDSNDTNRPKLEIGETVVLLPEDKSPFSIFGNVEPGHQIPTIHNAMFRAPVFKHAPKSTDFLISRSTTGVYGSEWFIRPLDHIFTVGQQFPSVEVPGTHSRKVTEAAKRRLRMIAYRVYDRFVKRGKSDPDVSPLTNEIIRHHLPGTDIAQNRGKMREFMQYDKESCTWSPKPGDSVPSVETLRSWIKPEDICLLDNMQVGQRQLLDAGCQGDDVGEEERDGMGLEQRLAPWNTTKNFLNACQGKAMLELHGEGDPSGRGEAFSFIKTSMKGGFKPIGESIEDRLDAKRLKENGGHTYNVAKQQKSYHDAIQRIWDSQIQSLSSTIEQDELEQGIDEYVDDTRGPSQARLRSAKGSNLFHLKGDDDSVSQFSRFSTSSQRGKVLKINRTTKGAGPGQTDQVEEAIITDPRVIKEYLRRRRQEELNSLNLQDMKPTGDPEIDAQQQKRLLEELARLERNKERRYTREKARGMRAGSDISVPTTPGSPFHGPMSAALSTTASTALGSGLAAGALSGSGTRSQGTQRRCANCGQVGHIKTNKKLCPMLNGTIKGSDADGPAAVESAVDQVLTAPSPHPTPSMVDIAE